MALSKFKKGVEDNSINVNSFHRNTGGINCNNANDINFQSLETASIKEVKLVTDEELEQDNVALQGFRKLSKNWQKYARNRESALTQIVENNKALTSLIKASSNAETSNQELLGEINKTLQTNRTKTARIKANSQQQIDQANSQISAIFSASKQSIKDSIF